MRTHTSSPNRASAVARALFPAGRTPLSAVRDMIGSQSTKGLYFLRKSGMSQRPSTVWKAENWTAIETYPTPVRTSEILKPHFRRLRSDPLFAKVAQTKKVKQDLKDSLWCALVAAVWKLEPTLLVPPPNEGYLRDRRLIWTPADCRMPVDVASDESGSSDG